MMKLFFTFVVLVSSWGSAAFAQEVRDVREPYRMELKSLFQTIENNYGPLELKAKTIGLDWEKTKANTLQRLEGMDSNVDYYYLVADLLNGFNDAHVSVSLPSSYRISLNVQFSLVEGKAILSYFDREEFKKRQCDAEIGDELITFGGQTPETLQTLNLVFNKNGNELTNRSYFYRTIGRFSQEKGLDLPYYSPSSPLFVELVFESPSRDRKICLLQYRVGGVPLLGRKFDPSSVPGEETEKKVEQKTLTQVEREIRQRLQASASEEPRLNAALSRLNVEGVKKLARVQVWVERFSKLFNAHASLNENFRELEKTVTSTNQADGMVFSLGAKKPFFKLPKKFKEIKPFFNKDLLTSSGLLVGTFEYGGDTVGFMRIPSYMPDSDIGTTLISLRYYIAKLQEKTDYLVIDQTNNPGGMVVYSDLIVRALVGQYDSEKHMKFLVKPTQSFLREYAELIEELKAIAVDFGVTEQLMNLLTRAAEDFGRIYEAYASGRSLSEPVSLRTMAEIIEYMIDSSLDQLPFKGLVRMVFGGGVNIFENQVYTKPVYFMINELDFSGGDATPAVLQDYGRAKLIGTRTSGAGGTVEEFRNDMMNSFSYRLTTSLMYRKDGKFVENYGVQPDIAFEPIRSDYVDGFSRYFGRLMQVIYSDLHPAPLK